MQLKLDENLGDRGRMLLRNAGHDVSTVADQGMTTAEDRELFDTCKREDRALVTLDLDFANPLQFPPRGSPGLAVLRLPRKPTAEDLRQVLRVLVRALEVEVLRDNLWIVEMDRIRIYQPE